MNIIRVKIRDWHNDNKTQTPRKRGQKITIYIDQIDPVTLNQINNIIDDLADI
jgi:hypothetical protein